MVLVDIREASLLFLDGEWSAHEQFYKDKKDGQVKPGSKGISLTLEQVGHTHHVL